MLDITSNIVIIKNQQPETRCSSCCFYLLYIYKLALKVTKIFLPGALIPLAKYL